MVDGFGKLMKRSAGIAASYSSVPGCICRLFMIPLVAAIVLIVAVSHRYGQLNE
jgi:hypothetical protein